jgi:Protein of unknown function (DUF4065)
MIVSHNLEKLINTVNYLAQQTKYCGKIKLIKLLYLLDFEHFRQTGRSVTGLDYHAWRMGPVPVDFYQEWDDLAPDLVDAITIVPKQVIDYVREEVTPRKSFDDRHFSKRELRIMENLAVRFRDDYSRPASTAAHMPATTWALWAGRWARRVGSICEDWTTST